MNELYQYDPFTGGPVRPSFGVTPSHSALDALFQDLTRRQILDAFGGQADPGFLDMLINGGAQQAMAASAAQPASAAPAAVPTPEGTMMALPDGRNDGYDAGGLYGSDGYGLFGRSGGGEMVDGTASGGFGVGLSQEEALAMGLQEASSTHGGGPSGPGGKGG